MPEYERSVTLAVDADEAFRYLSDPRNMTAYVASMVAARPEHGDILRVAADVQGRHEEGEASLRSDPAERRLEWGSPANPRYRGWLQVSRSGGSSTVTIHISTDHEQDTEAAERALEDTLAAVRTRLERA